jgi:hypothetical protein
VKKLATILARETILLQKTAVHCSLKKVPKKVAKTPVKIKGKIFPRKADTVAEMGGGGSLNISRIYVPLNFPGFST